ncbi:hypothetical protein FOZ60_016003 [Perkinsus olseni]|uniref:Dynein regulatory complex subunit 7 C-terminal domain-containing protein n=1 Tax=Perkinsus olseni TaxID=32597 RepID=A0A7J6P595_PEROL|nr:hypothetical protein FOZ60_016003 [Perkinsus olseni]
MAAVVSRLIWCDPSGCIVFFAIGTATQSLLPYSGAKSLEHTISTLKRTLRIAGLPEPCHGCRGKEALKKRRAQIQRRSGPDVQQGRTESDFEKYQTFAMFRIQILEQRLVRHEVQTFKKFTELEETLLADPRLQAMWDKDSSDEEGEDEPSCGEA